MDNEEINYKKHDTQCIVAYIVERCGRVVSVDEILQYSGADRLRVYPALFELEQDGWLEVVEREVLGAPLMVRMKMNHLTSSDCNSKENKIGFE